MTRRTVASSKPSRDDRRDRRVVLDVALEDRVEYVVGRQALVVALVGSQLGRRRLFEHVGGNDVATGAFVAPTGEREHERLGNVADHREPTGRVAVQRGVADGDLALVAAGQHRRPPELVRQGHHQHAADAALQVFLRQVGSAVPRSRLASISRKAACAGSIGIVAEVDAEVGGELRGVAFGVGAAVARRHRHDVHAVGTERVGGDGRHQRRVDAAGKRETRPRESRSCRRSRAWPAPARRTPRRGRRVGGAISPLSTPSSNSMMAVCSTICGACAASDPSAWRANDPPSKISSS